MEPLKERDNEVPDERGVAIIGAGAHARVVASVLRAAGTSITGHYDDDAETWGTDLGYATVLGPTSRIPEGSRAIIGIGDNWARREMARRLDLDWTTAIHPFSWLEPDVQLGPGSVVCAGALVMTGASIGSHVILNNRAGVGHDARVDDFGHLTVAHLGGGSIAEEGVLMGIGSVVIPRRRVGAWAVVGAGAVVIADVHPETVVVGNPARVLRTRTPGSTQATTV